MNNPNMSATRSEGRMTAEEMELRWAIKRAIEVRGSRAYTIWFANWCRDNQVDTQRVPLRQVTQAIWRWLEEQR